MRIRVGCEFVWETTAPVPMLMLVRPRADADHLTVYESTWSEPDLPIHEYTDLHGNNCWRFLAPTGTSAIRYDALLAVAFCRALNIPARYTFGYLPDIAIEPPDVPMDFHTWFEAYVGGRWYTFDARHNTPRVGRVVIGRGRDAVDCALSTAYGNARLAKFTVWSDEITAERPGGPPREEDADSAEAAARARS